MTRANIVIKQRYFPTKAYLEIGSDGYPEEVLPSLIDFMLEHVNKGAVYRNGTKSEDKKENILFDQISSIPLTNLLNETFATIGKVGNFSYAYEVDLIKGTLKAWESKIRWINAPENWKERGWSCWIGKNGRYGYTTWVKAKKLFDVSINDLLEGGEFKINNKTIKVHKLDLEIA